jgi:cold-inducible RNA-binding protein
MNSKLYVGNLSFNTTEEELKVLFAPFGAVTEVNLVVDRMSGRSRGFGFVTMSTAEEAQAAIKELSGKQIGGRAITVSEAHGKEEGGAGGRGDRGGNPGQKRESFRERH